MQGLLLSVKDILGMMMVAALVVAVVSAFIPFHKGEGREDWRGYGMTDSIYLSYSFAVTVWLSADCCQIGIIPEKEEILPQFLQYPEIYVSLQSQMNMVPIVQLVRASDCGSECRRFESDLVLNVVGSNPTGHPPESP